MGKGSSSSVSVCTCLWYFIITGVDLSCRLLAFQSFLDRSVCLSKDSIEARDAFFCCLWPEEGRKERQQQDSICCLVLQGYQVCLACCKLSCPPMRSAPSGITSAQPNTSHIQCAVGTSHIQRPHDTWKAKLENMQVQGPSGMELEERACHQEVQEVLLLIGLSGIWF